MRLTEQQSEEIVKILKNSHVAIVLTKEAGPQTLTIRKINTSKQDTDLDVWLISNGSTKSASTSLIGVMNRIECECSMRDMVWV